jgi:hypothetical protein
VAEPWKVVAAPKMRRGPVVPLAFRDSLFTELRRDRFELVPAFGLAQLRELSFAIADVPGWVHPVFGPVIAAAACESARESRGIEHARMDSWNGWFASPEWLASLVESAGGAEGALIRFWRKESSPKRGAERTSEAVIEYGLEVVDHPVRPSTRPGGPSDVE